MMYGIASKQKHEPIKQFGGIPIERHAKDLVKFIRARELEGLDSAFDAIDACKAWQSFQLLQKGGKLVSYGVTASIQNGKINHLSALMSYALPVILNAIPHGKRAIFYGITLLYSKDPTPFREDLTTLFQLLSARKIRPVITNIFHL